MGTMEAVLIPLLVLAIVVLVGEFAMWRVSRGRAIRDERTPPCEPPAE
jgi:hypothetical protein